MAHPTWLLSLDEDWVSQPRSDNSQAQLPNPSSPSVLTDSKNARGRSSRIPRFNAGHAGGMRPQQHTHNSSFNVLSERSPNDVNIRVSQPAPSKLSGGIKPSYRGRHLSRSVSASTAGSVIHNSVLQNKSQSASPSKSREDAPEWKRRLLYGELNYGESKDLFSSAGIGLENIFRPPEAPETCSEEMVENEGYTMYETTLPSSPPPYSGTRQHIIEDDNTLEQDTHDASVQHNTSFPKPITSQQTGHGSIEAHRGVNSAEEEEEHVNGETQLDSVAESSVMSFRRKQLFDESRKTSGQSDLRNEDFSPIFIARRSSDDGDVSFAPVELPAHQLRKKLEHLRMNQMILDSEAFNDQGGAVAAGDGTGDFEITENYAKMGGFLNLQRGGRSTEGSFLQRPLSPPINMDTSEMLPESSLQASTPKRFPTVRTDRFVSGGRTDTQASPPSPALPRAPYPSPEKRFQPAFTSNTSPLKLFGPYDTFTNQTLLRRISQFEDQQSNSVSYSADDIAVSPAPTSLSKSELHDEVADVPPTQKTLQSSHGHHEIVGAVNKFGAGELDSYEFDGDISLSSSIPCCSEEKENETPVRSRPSSGYPLKFDIHEDVSSEGESLVVRRHRDKRSVSVRPVPILRASKSLDALHLQKPHEINRSSSSSPVTTKRDGSEGKRPRTSPSKDPTPKRRRTLHRSDIAYGLEDRRAAIETVQSSHYNMQSAIARDRKNAYHGKLQKLVDLNILAVRPILRPGSPTPNQRASILRERPPLAELGLTPDEELAQVPTTEENTHDHGASGSRKTSMKTQDFFDAAEEIMAMIRNKARPKTGLASVEESEAESSERPTHNGSGATEDSFQESTKEPFSRPPSRDGLPVSRMPLRQEDPELVDQLKKYEERSDLGDILTHSMRSMEDQRSRSISRPNRRDFSSSQISHTSQHEDYIISDLPNVRISRNPEAVEVGGNATEFPSHNSRSSGGSTNRSVPTSSSRGSDSKRLIAPDVVAQLIGNQVGNMVFDEEHKMWQKVKTPRPAMSILPSEDSEDDPFASIPDLTVDLAKEIKNLDLALGQSRPGLKQLSQNDNSLDRSPSSAGRITEEMITSEQIIKGNGHIHAETAVEDDEEIEHEITLHENRIQKATPSLRRNLTITFSSPIASIIQDVAHRDSDDGSHGDESTLEPSLGNIAADSIKRGRHSKIGRSITGKAAKSTSRSRSRGVSRNLSVEGRAFIPRPVSRIDEQDENTSADNAEPEEQGQVSIRAESSIAVLEPEAMENADLSVVMATPGAVRTAAMCATPMVGQYVGTLSLSPLSEFTVHQVDNSCALEVSYIVGDQYLVTGNGSKKIMSKAVRSLVEKITEVEPFEPDWESMQELDISEKQLDTLHMLDEFCTKVVTLDASKNSVSHLDGVPQSVRNLRMTHNVLSELTAWRHLMNLQYIDISNNQIKSLSAFKDLVHLRTLRADNNQITSLDGIKFHDSLQVLRARGNLITHVDFDGTKMQRLTELDLENNQIVSFENSEQLSCLTTLNLQHNLLTSFSPSNGQSWPCLRYLKLSNNGLKALHLGATPSLRLLHADRNNITSIIGFSRCRRLDTLSLREQKDIDTLDTSFLDSACEVRKMFLSGNRLSSFNPGVDFLNLQYLELANCGLQTLGPDVGQLLPNLRVLNINFNAIEDLRPLRYIPKLKKLLAAGNRLSEAGKVANALAELPHLSRLDLRNNGVTLGYYAPVQTLVSVEGAEFDPFVLPDVDVGRHEKFASRLDMNTRMRKRVYDMVVLNACKQLKMLDGLPAAKDIASKRDDVWDALVESGIVEEGEKDSEPDSEATLR
ncbi:hypothetical protein F5Y19DRAFT_239375 [Xylariaceae sp. FL1651]|nr:hypothetical protein F5Y19DRAFT_239375 [Xylariaceae sp. FL1651]